MNEPITCVFSLKPIRSNLPLPHFKDPSGDRLQNVQLYRILQPQSQNQPRNRQKVSPQLFVLKLVLLRGRDFSCEFCSPFTWPHFYLPPHFLLAFLCLCYPSTLSSPTLASSCLYLCSGLKQRSLNHIRDGSFAFRHPLYPSSAAGVVSFLMFLSYFGFQSPLIPFVLHPSF